MIYKTQTKFKQLIYIFLIIVTFSSEAYAYLDPGTGGVIIQALLVSLVSVSFFFKTIKTKFLGFINRFSKNKNKIKERKK